MPTPAEDFNYLVVSDLHLSEAERNPAGRFLSGKQLRSSALSMSCVGSAVAAHHRRRLRRVFQMTEAPDPPSGCCVA
jgi:hypothetical protein